MYKMVVITVQKYTDAEVHTQKVGNRELFWVKMIDVQNKLGIKNISDLVRKNIDEKGHKNGNIDHEIKRQKALEKEFNCEFIRINPDEKGFNIFKALNEIHRHIKKSIKKSLTDELSNKLLRLEFKSNNSIKAKCLKYVVKHTFPTI